MALDDGSWCEVAPVGEPVREGLGDLAQARACDVVSGVRWASQAARVEWLCSSAWFAHDGEFWAVREDGVVCDEREVPAHCGGCDP